MLRHLFKLIWNKKKENFLLISEIFISFIVTFAVFTLLVNFYRNYKKPAGMTYENVWTVNIGSTGLSKNKDSLLLVHENLKNALLSLPQIKAVSYTGNNTPFSNSSTMSGLSYLHHDVSRVDMYRGETSYGKVLGLKLVSGRWFENQDRAVKYSPIVINQVAVEKLMIKNPVGTVLGNKNENQLKIIGVVEDMKDKGDFLAPGPKMYTISDTGSVAYMSTILLKVSPDADANFESKVYKLIANSSKGSNVEIGHLTEARRKKNLEVLIPMIILMIISSFLIFNVALGLFGVLWYNISKRRGEIGLRRAIGASAFSVSSQLVGEALVLATFSLIIGSFFAIQFPLLHVFDLPAPIYLTSLFLSIVFIYLLVIFCALYPGKHAASIHPAVALHED
ncbi:ABC transporter permease [Pedobacter sp. L105]|uniref:ABC transporter permease n=1 Tax=Pedobacter sp. L105 TaxID=1641871 RepID=UPI00131DA18D|nr:FtsX-like permease family protein [Pedobacter sp. L105]